MNKPLLFYPESKSQLRSRVKAAMEQQFTVNQVSDHDRENNPIFNRRHVFDFHSGLRVIITKEIHEVPDGHKEYAHISFSWPGAHDINPREKLKIYIDVFVGLFRITENVNLEFVEGKAASHAFIETKLLPPLKY